MAAKTNPGVWGVDIGQCALKAMRCEMQDGEIVATQVDYIEYPKILSQPDADPEALIADALEQLRERNDIGDERVAVSVSGQAGLAKFFKPPPIEQKKLRDIVEFEARQQIPFDLTEVVWDYQQMGGGAELEGLITEAEVGLFAMKRDQVIREMRPFNDAELKLDAIQLAPMAVYNCVTYDLLDNCPDPDAFDADSPPASYMVLSIGTETTDMLITNGFRVWHRSIPIGGNHFTRQMTQQLKLTFAKAEHLKRNAREAPDPKRVFQAMRSVYDNLGTEVQRSLRFFEGIDRKATIKGVVVLGNTAKLPGLRSFIGKKLELGLVELETWNRLKGSSVTASPTFRNNVLAYGNCYGLCLQALGVAQLQTNLLPRELLFDRLVDSKKPWVVAAIALLLISFTFNYFLNYAQWDRVAHDQSGASPKGKWEEVISKADRTKSDSTSKKNAYDKAKKDYENLLEFGNQLIGNGDRQVMWLELIGAINFVLPGEQSQWRDPDVIDFEDRPDFYIDSVDNAFFTEDDLATWWEQNEDKYTANLDEIDKTRELWLHYTNETNKSFVQNNAGFVNYLNLYELKRQGEEWTQKALGALDKNSDKQLDEKEFKPKEAEFNGEQLLEFFRPANKNPEDKNFSEQELVNHFIQQGMFWKSDKTQGSSSPIARALRNAVSGQTNSRSSQNSGSGSSDGGEFEAPEDGAWIIQLKGYHYFNPNNQIGRKSHVQYALLERLRHTVLAIPTPFGVTPFSMEQMGIKHIVLVESKTEGKVVIGGSSGNNGVGGDPTGGGTGGTDPTGGLGGDAAGAIGGGTTGASGDNNAAVEESKTYTAEKYSFTIQFMWEPNEVSERWRLKDEADQAARLEA
ncbi:MAG: pilus assembly protein PilM [Planctomycetota bacterium]|nr:pilus assembly protein PilM [Planctomycetota bacterium]